MTTQKHHFRPLIPHKAQTRLYHPNSHTKNCTRGVTVTNERAIHATHSFFPTLILKASHRDNHRRKDPFPNNNLTFFSFFPFISSTQTNSRLKRNARATKRSPVSKGDEHSVLEPRDRPRVVIDVERVVLHHGAVRPAQVHHQRNPDQHQRSRHPYYLRKPSRHCVRLYNSSALALEQGVLVLSRVQGMP